MSEKVRYYAIYTGKGDGVVIHKAWDDIEEVVTSLLRVNPQAKQHGFDNEKDAKKFARNGYDEKDKENLLASRKLNKEIDRKIDNLSEDEVIAFIDASYLTKEQKAGYGALIFTNKGPNHPKRLFGKINNRLDSHTGEFKAAEEAIDWAIANGKKEITIYHDYEWVDFTKKAKDPESIIQEYYDWIANKEKEHSFKISFYKVPAYGHITYHNEVVHLAKAGARGV